MTKYIFLFVAVGTVIFVSWVYYFSTNSTETKQSELIPVWQKQVENNKKIEQKNQTDFIQDTVIRTQFKTKLKAIDQRQDSTLQITKSVSNQELEVQFSNL